jgi:hypothetical protein
MSEGSKTPFDQLKNIIQNGNKALAVYKNSLIEQRRIYGDLALNKVLYGHDWIYDFIKHKDIENAYFFMRPKYRIENYIFDQFSKLTRPAIYHIGSGIGTTMDKVVGCTYSSAHPANIWTIFQHSDLTWKYFAQRKMLYQRYYNAINFNSFISTGWNLQQIWLQQVKQSLGVQKYIWDNRLTSQYGILQPNRMIMDKSKQLAGGYFDVITDRFAEIAGWIGIGVLVFTLPKSVRTRTKVATQRWSSRLFVNYLPFMFRVPIRMFVIKPPVKVLYNPAVFAGLVLYKYLTGLGQKIEASIELQQNEPEIYRQLVSQDRDTYAASGVNDLIKSLKQSKSNGVNS